MKTISHQIPQSSEVDSPLQQPTDLQLDEAAFVQAAFNQARAVALRFLAHRPRTEAEIRRRLEPANTSDVVNQVVAWLQGQRYLDDAAFAAEWRRQRELRRPRSESLIRRELSRLGVSREVVETALEGFDAGENAYLAAQKPAARLKGADQARFKQRLWGFLQRRGFKPDVIGITVQRLWDELSDPLDCHVDADPNEEQSYDPEIEWRE
jgi:SOS response regulatory protein OraA/RecX